MFLLYIKKILFPMGELIEKVGLRMLVDGSGLADNFKNNSLYFYDKYQRLHKIHL